MRLHTLLSLLLTLLTTLTLALDQDQTTNIFAWPLTNPQPTTLAKITHNTTHATVNAYTPPKLSPSDSLVRIGFHPNPADKTSWTGVATSASNFADDNRQKVLSLHLNHAGVVSHVSFKTGKGRSPAQGGKSKDGGLVVEVVRIAAGPQPVLNKPVVLRDDGKVEGEEGEKSFFQK